MDADQNILPIGENIITASYDVGAVPLIESRGDSVQAVITENIQDFVGGAAWARLTMVGVVSAR